MIIWLNEDRSIRMVSYTPRDNGTFGGYDVEEIPEAPEGKDVRFDPATREFYFVDPETEVEEN